jgi:diaminohydroxyphosphoribosylaminopyrimidine deaminase/5-amino-6-(5-phosphoribosylamino)uracil reductase
MNYDLLMRKAIEISAPYKYLVKPNPMVGALIVKDGKILAEGAHEKFGEAHAEVNCFNSLKEKIEEDHVMICTLEPCNHYGKTPPCTKKIIESGIKKIIIGSLDPNPKVAGTGIKTLKDAGLEVSYGVLEKEVRELNKFFFFKHENGRPFITIKIASSADWMSHSKDGSTTWITSEASRKDVQLIRAEHDAILTGGNTIRSDQPRMNARVEFPLIQPQKILLSEQKEWDVSLDFFQDSKVKIIDEKDLVKVVEVLSKQEINSLLVEAGPRLVNSFLKEEFCDEMIIYQSPDQLGEDGVSWSLNDAMIDKYGLSLKSSYTIDRDKKTVFEK